MLSIKQPLNTETKKLKIAIVKIKILIFTIGLKGSINH